MDKSVTLKNPKTFIFLICFVILSCTHKNTININEITKPVIDEYQIDKNHNYSAYFIKVNGQVDDTIMINDVLKLSGKIDTIFRTDYYGGGESMILNYKPYLAKKGYLKIVHYAN